MTKTYELPNEKMIMADVDEKHHTATVSVYALDDLVEAVNKAGQWNPVSEDMPKAEYGESNSVLVCFENGTQDVLYFNGGNWCYPTGETYISVNHKNGWHNKVVAWMPLPKPARLEEDNG